jgi:uncharacterized caspase-like protein
MSECIFDRSSRLGSKAGSRLIHSLLLLACVVFFLNYGQSAALAQTRVALVIGNGNYQFAPGLKNTVNDAKIVGQALKSAGFEVATATDVNRAQLDKALREFLSRVAAKGKEAIALLFYAGQGVEIDGDNFLVPVDIKIQRQADIVAQAVPLSALLTSLSMLPTAARIVVLDTSRSNPFSAAGRASAAVEVPRGSIVAFSTSPGGEASEGAEANSPFAAALVETIKEPGLTIEQVFQRVKAKVSKATDGQQVPQEISGLTAQIPFSAIAAKAAPAPEPAVSPPNPAAAPAKAAPPPEPPTAAPGQADDAAARRDFELALGVNTKEAWTAFLQTYPSGFYASLAKAQLNKLTGAGAN